MKKVVIVFTWRRHSPRCWVYCYLHYHLYLCPGYLSEGQTSAKERRVLCRERGI